MNLTELARLDSKRTPIANHIHAYIYTCELHIALTGAANVTGEGESPSSEYAQVACACVCVHACVCVRACASVMRRCARAYIDAYCSIALTSAAKATAEGVSPSSENTQVVGVMSHWGMILDLRVCMYVYVCMCVWEYAYVLSFCLRHEPLRHYMTICETTHIHAHIHIYTCTHTYNNAHTHMYIYTYIPICEAIHVHSWVFFDLQN